MKRRIENVIMLAGAVCCIYLVGAWVVGVIQQLT